MQGPSNDNSHPGRQERLGAGGWFTLLVLAGFLIVAIWYATYAWSSLSGVGLSPLGWLFLGLGIVVTFLVGAGLMALVFFSSRNNFDQ
ncbi:MAG: hypothetical protein GC166_14675 [Alphaproteobacteria bacterium]|nr:hypothetical protein [Alphaproteobacteria bacterium]